MKQLKIFLIFSIFFLASTLVSPGKSYAIEDPLALPNNKFGIHILFTSELKEASSLINANGGEWGYVVIPIQSGDKDLEKWQSFMNEAKSLKVIPIIRLATEGDYFNTKVWRRPTHADIVDFANFLHSLDWPTKNQYVTVFNEVNRGDEWGGSANPEEYAELLSYAVSVFKSKNQDFFIISAGLDNAAPNQGSDYIAQYPYMRGMDAAVPGIFNQIDGLGSHSYPNPGFSQPPSDDSSKGISSFKYERDLAASLSNKTLPVFITETGWTSEKISDDRRATYYAEAFSGAWSDNGIVAVAPFLLRAGGGPFTIFSFLRDDGSKTKQYEVYHGFPKVKGKPTINNYTDRLKILAVEQSGKDVVRTKDFSKNQIKRKDFSIQVALQGAFEWIMNLN